MAVEPVLVQPAPVNAAQVNAPVNAIIAEEHAVQDAVENKPETEILTINYDDEGVEISCDDEEAELPPEAEVSSVVSAIQQPVITSESLAQLLKSITEKMGNPPSDPSVHVEEQTSSDPKDPDTLPLKRKRRDPRPGMYVEQSQDQPIYDTKDEDGLYDFDFEKNTTDTTTATENIFEFDVDTQRMDADEDRARAFAKDDAERNAAMEHYFKRVTDKDADKAKAERIKKKREFVILKNKNLNPEDDDAQATHHLMDVGETLYDKVGNLSGVVSWGFDHDRRRWWIKRKVGPVEWYKNPAQFQTFTKVDLITLSRSPYVDDKLGGRGYLFFERLQREVARDFPSMRTAESIVTPAAKGDRDPHTNKRMKILSWPPTDKEKTIPLVKKIPKGPLKTMQFWAYDERLGQAVIVCDDNVSFRLIGQVDLLKLDK
ncbi:hypothetical protein HanHA300_Chr01g0022361 [Helianthus annuus]|nr:hypothetical protein HanHA300_Chr01g0022361 [Helianthus annuus]